MTMTRAEIARMGGRKAHEVGRAHEFTPEEAAAAGSKGGTKVSQDRDHMASIGRKGGAKVARDRSHMARIGAKGGQKVASDREHMRAIGRKGGAARKAKVEEEAGR